jgi:hypothetical protein
MPLQVTETQARENVREALVKYQGLIEEKLDDPDERDREHLIVSRAEIKCARRLLWMD